MIKATELRIGNYRQIKVQETDTTEKSITPEFLESKGFALFTSKNDSSFDGYIPELFDVELYPEGEACYFEKKHNRNQFCVVFSKLRRSDDQDYKCLVYVQNDVGCGFTLIPDNFKIMTEYHFGLLYEAIRREKL